MMVPSMRAPYLSPMPQVQWMRSFVQALQKPPGYLRALLRRGTYFVRKPPAAVPKLIQQVRQGWLALVPRQQCWPGAGVQANNLPRWV